MQLGGSNFASARELFRVDYLNAYERTPTSAADAPVGFLRPDPANFVAEKRVHGVRPTIYSGFANLEKPCGIGHEHSHPAVERPFATVMTPFVGALFAVALQ